MKWQRVLSPWEMCHPPRNVSNVFFWLITLRCQRHAYYVTSIWGSDFRAVSRHRYSISCFRYSFPN
ncbi:hypothetical protein M5D96_005297 [Drosophila gunungcola]|uniref:Uncharacterized protein n=1 Tax=Drosophila gunungcola TaxID=103775 RepID=A0A9Q0BR16_9MUSC|nr:hypothetical protein M5D96_005297 [Drosophila gunungcola]